MTIPVEKRVLEAGGDYRVIVRAAVADPDQIRLYRNRVRVLLTPVDGGYMACIHAQPYDLLEASTADGTPCALEVALP